MPQLVLIKHSAVEIDAVVPPKQWRLTGEGRDRCRPLATLLRQHSLASLVSSIEPKAVETAEILSRRLRVPTTALPDLDEHRRPYAEPGRFEALMERFFAEPGQRVFGEESANEALQRFWAALAAALEQHSEGNLGVVSHGTVIALYAAPIFGVGAAALWQRLQEPSFLAIDTETNAAIRIVDELD